MSKVLVIVHGAGKQMSDFYKKPVADLGNVLRAEPACVPCWYADLSDLGAPVFGPGDPEADAFRTRIIEDLMKQEAEIAAQEPPVPASLSVTELATLVADLVNDVTRYLYDPALQGKMRSRLREAMDKAKAYDETVLVSHSLGTVLAYDVLREHADAYNVSHFVTMGSPLRKVVRAGARTADVGAITEQHVPMWRNLYDPRDPVANTIGPAFPGYPVQDVYTSAGTSFIPAHDYWGRGAVVQMIAGFLK
jgi:hypothetical protein